MDRRILLVVFNILLSKGVESLDCFSCGKLTEDPLRMEDCNKENQKTTRCSAGEFCLTYVRIYAKGSEPVTGCYPMNKTLPGLTKKLVPEPTCKLQGSSSVRYCMCDTDNCNNIAFNIRAERAGTSNLNPVCPSVEVKNAEYADCNGEYQVSSELVDWAPQRQVYKHVTKDRYIFWNAGGLGWSIGKKDYLSTGSHWHRSGLDSEEPWDGKWDGGVLVTCKDTSGPTVNCLWSGYTSWSSCSTTCGLGQQFRTRNVLQPSRGGGQACLGAARDTKPCTLRQCPRDCVWGDYGPWSDCSKSCGGGSRTRTRVKARRADRGGQDCPGKDKEVQFCNTERCSSTDACCNKVSVGSTGNARIDQALYMGIYDRIDNPYNGKPVYRREGRNPLYIYFFTSAKDRLSLWVIGPELGQFIAGIRNSKAGNCVHDLEGGWKYASRAGVWEDNDPSLSVKCYDDRPISNNSDNDNNKNNNNDDKKNDISDDIIDDVFGSKNSRQKVDCQWSEYGSWSECSKSCNKGTQVRVRVVLRQPRAGGRQCRGGNRQRRACNQTPCDVLRSTSTTTTTTTTTRRPITRRPTTTTTTTRRPTTRRPTTRRPTTRRPTTRRPTTTTRPRNTRIETAPPPNRNPNRVRCFTCGSLYSTDAPNCPTFNQQDPAQATECGVGEACLYYSWKTSDTDTSVIRECFPTSILLGSIDNPVEPTSTCSPQPVESDTIQACICTSDLCNLVDTPDTKISRTPTQDTRRTTTRPPRRTTTTAPTRRITTTRATRRPTTQVSRRNTPAPTRSRPDRVRCHQCGTLFSTSTSNPDCTVFDESDPSQADYCQPGEACLWYSWQKSANDVAHIRECFSTSILLGSLSDPLLPTPTCTTKDISEDPQSKITACLCESDLCNSYRGPDEPRVSSRPSSNTPKEEPRTITRRPPARNQVTTTTANPFQASFTRKPQTSPQRRPPTTTRSPPRGFPDRIDQPRAEPLTQSVQVFHPSQPGLQCYSCGSLLDANKKCDVFDRKATSQVATCSSDEACLMYSWKKSSTEIATLRECFPKSILLGSVNNPLTPTDSCSQRDITDDNSGSIFACLCNTDFCNDDASTPLGADTQRPAVTSAPARRPPTTRPTTRRPTTRRPTTRRPTTRRPQSAAQSLQGCPRGFESVGSGCYLISNDRVGWIEARKMCEQSKAKLISLDTESKREDLAILVRSIIRRRRSEFWLSGNDIEEEGVWEWAKTRDSVPAFGWTEDPFNSPEENCLAWTLTESSRRLSDGWHSSSCCNNLRYICEL